MRRDNRKDANFRTIECHNCGGKNHMAKDCPTQDLTKVFASTKKELERIRCYMYNRIGHMSTDHSDHRNYNKKVNNVN